MKDQEIEIVQHTWLNVAQKDDTSIGELFYTRLFQNSPQLKSIFNNEISVHSKQFVSVMNYMISKLDNACLLHEARQLGKKYANYGIRTEHYDSIKEALFWALRKKLGDQWTPTVMVSWIWFFSTLSFIMKGAAQERA